MELGRVIYYLDMWREYMKSDNNKLGYKSKSSGFHTGGVHSFDDIADEVDNNSVRVVDKVIDDLPSFQRNAIYVIYLGQKTMMDMKVLDRYYDNAIAMLQQKLTEKNLY